MTEQITIKLNKKTFKPVIDDLKSFGGAGLTDSDSDLAGKCIYFVHFFLFEKQESGKSVYEDYFDRKGITKADGILKFLNSYYTFKKQGLKAAGKKMPR
ncbi:hypothetical protein KY363_01995 [Candidatus Woesearchaeota archaeon]|nr:hypothetical protein [Candidatus Woesearchaeota archaeon]